MRDNKNKSLIIIIKNGHKEEKKKGMRGEGKEKATKV